MMFTFYLKMYTGAYVFNTEAFGTNTFELQDKPHNSSAVGDLRLEKHRRERVDLLLCLGASRRLPLGLCQADGIRYIDFGRAGGFGITSSTN